MSLCAYVECRKEVDENKWHIPTKIGLMHVMCNTRYETGLCGKCENPVDGAESGAVNHKGKLYHRSCLGDLWQSPHVQLALFGRSE